MLPHRPDLSQVEQSIKHYIEALEAELERLRRPQPSEADGPAASLESTEPPTPLNVITVSGGGLVKRSPRHLYSRQRRGGMGIFDLELSDDDDPTHLLVADQDQDVLIVTNHSRTFRLPVSRLTETAIRAKGESLLDQLPLNEDEQPALILPHQREGYLTVVSDQAHVRRFRYHYFRDDMTPGLVLYDTKKFGPPTVGCWTSGEDDLFIATEQGKAIRFPESKITTMGITGLRLDSGDRIIGATGVNDRSGVLLLTADGRGTIRLMSGFSANKSAGGSGKIAMKADNTVTAVTVGRKDDILIISRLSKIIRFTAAEIPLKEGVVQGVNCMGLRGDQIAAATVTGPA